MSRFLVLGLALLALALSACVPSSTQVLGSNSRTYTLEANTFDQSRFTIRDAGSGFAYYIVEPRGLGITDSWKISTLQGQNVGRVDRKLIALTPTFDIYRQNNLVATLGQDVADLVRNSFLADQLGESYTIKMLDGSSYVLVGDVFNLNYQILRQGTQVANVSKPPISMIGFLDTGNYFVEIASDQDDIFILEMVLAFNELIKAQE